MRIHDAPPQDSSLIATRTPQSPRTRLNRDVLVPCFAQPRYAMRPPIAQLAAVQIECRRSDRIMSFCLKQARAHLAKKVEVKTSFGD
jgi:hypothetical protein